MWNPPASWPGCHGVRVAALGDLDIGRCRGTPLADVEVLIGPVPPPSGVRLWSLAGPTDSGSVHDQHLHQPAEEEFHLQIGDHRRVAVSVAGGRITVSPPFDPIQAQLVVSFGFPLLLERQPVLVLHGAAVSRDGVAVVIAGSPGSGKSSSLVGLIDAGWNAISEDVCIVDLGAAIPQIWPGPPWVRRHHVHARHSRGLSREREPGPSVRVTARPQPISDAAP